MPRHLVDVADLSPDDIDWLFDGADAGPQPGSLVGTTCLAAFFQESTRTRLGFMSAAARQGAIALDAGSADRLRVEPPEDQRMVLAGVADVAVVRHWDASFARRLAAAGRCAVVNAGAGATSHPTQALIDAYTLTKTFGPDLAGLRVVFVGPLLRSAVCFGALGPRLGISVTRCDVGAEARGRGEAELRAADVIYIQSLSDARYGEPVLNTASRGAPLPAWLLDEIAGSTARIMHALPRGPELPDELARDPRSLVADQVELGTPLRCAVLRWLVART